MGFSADDPKWTAYVLGELSAEEHGNVERELAESADARREVAEIRNAVQIISAELKAGATPGLTTEQREGILKPTAPAPSMNANATVMHTVAAAPKPARRSRMLLYLIATAAALVIGVTLLWPSIRGDRNSLALAPGAPPPTAAFDKHSPADSRSDRAPSMMTVTPRIIIQEEEEDRLSVYDPNAEQEEDSYKVTSDYSSRTMNVPAESAGGGPSSGGGSGENGLVTNGSAQGGGTADGLLKNWNDPIASPTGATGPGDETTNGTNGARAGQAARGISSGIDAKFSGPGRSEGKTSPTLQGQLKASADFGGAGSKDGGKLPAARGVASSIGDSSGGNAVDRRLPAAPHTYTNAPSAIAGSGPVASESSMVNWDRDVPPSLRTNLGPVPQRVKAEQLERNNGEGYDPFVENRFLAARENPLSTFSIDVDTASYSIMRRYLTVNHQLPPKSAVRVEEMINYFHYDYPQPDGDAPFSANVEVAGCPWNAAHRLVRVGLKGKEMAANERPASNLVFLIDVSGSMAGENRLPLVKRSMKLLLDQLREKDHVAIVVYAGEAGLVLPSTSAADREPIVQAIDRLRASGSTNGGEGIQMAYRTALENFVKGGTNRVILATDGDFNVGTTDRTELVALVTAKAKQGVFLTALGFGMGNLRDDMLVQLADRGNGNYAYIDDFQEARKVFVEQLAGTLVTIAKDVKIQIEFNPAKVASYRLIGYEKRALRNEDFNNDKKDAGEIGAGHSVTALYEVAPPGAEEFRPAVDPLKYQNPVAKPAGGKPRSVKADDAGPAEPQAVSDELFTLKLRYKQPDGETSKLSEVAARDGGRRYAEATADFKFAASVALFGMILRNSEFKGDGTLDGVAELASEGIGKDLGGHRAEFLKLVEAAKQYSR